MAKRRSKSDITWQTTLQPALRNLVSLETNVVMLARGPVTFTLNDFVGRMVSDEALPALRAAFPLVRNADRCAANEQFQFTDATGEERKAVICMNLPAIQVLHPRAEYWHRHIEGPLLEMLQRMYEEYAKFQRVRSVIKWMDSNMTMRQIRHVAPWLHGILPPDSEFHAATGGVIPLVAMDHDKTEALRMAGTLVASALLCPVWQHENPSMLSAYFMDGDVSTTYTIL
jgi:hypothetical protein